MESLQRGNPRDPRFATGCLRKFLGETSSLVGFWERFFGIRGGEENIHWQGIWFQEAKEPGAAEQGEHLGLGAMLEVRGRVVERVLEMVHRRFQERGDAIVP